MRGLTGRALAATAVSGAAMLVGAAAAHAQKPASVGDGVKTGQLSVQMFNYGGYISSGANTGPANPVTGVSEACATATTPECRLERLERLFAYLESKGVTSVELFGHAGFPADADIAGLQAYRALLDRYHLHAAGWHGSVNEANWDARVNAAKILGADYIGSGGVADPGIGTYAAVLASANALNRLGKKSVEAGVGPVYIHNHEQEFDRQYVDDGVLKTAFDILMENTDPRYVVAEVDVFWSSDAFDDVTGTETAALINKWSNDRGYNRVQMLHIKDGIDIALRGPTSSRAGQPRAVGTGELDFRPILAAANNRVRYYHQEQDGGTLTDAEISLTNLKGVNTASVPTMLALPASFPAVPAGTSTTLPVVIQNTGDKPLTITGLAIGGDANDGPTAADFTIASQDCIGTPVQPGALATPTTPAVPRGTCTVQVTFRPLRSGVTSVARLQVTSDADNATERVLLTGSSEPGPLSTDTTIGGEVPGMLALTVPGPWSLGTFVPGVGRNYDVTIGVGVTSTAGDATLVLADRTGTAAGYLVNGTTPLAQPLQVRAPTADDPAPAYTPLDATPRTLRSYAGPVTNDGVQVDVRQAIGAAEPLRAGTYSKALTFTLSTGTP